MATRRRRSKGKPRTPIGEFFYRLLVFFRRLVDAFRHVRTGGESTWSKARARAAAPPRRCPHCQQEVSHSDDWRDHLDECFGERIGGPWDRYRDESLDDEPMGDEARYQR
ncbi:MAG TPA: hypothetical protein VK034_28820 [Enhygromyxa sp.]|nr:hypothetical protein [Enhygromyxa sp.]